MANKIKRSVMHQHIIDDLGELVEWHNDTSEKILLVDLQYPKLKLRIYIWNCTDPPGGRPLDEYKIQLIIDGQKRGERGHLDNSDGRLVLLMGYASPFESEDDGVYVLWDAMRHIDFGYSSNLQCRLAPMLNCLSEKIVVETAKRTEEQIIYALRSNLADAIVCRYDLDVQRLIV